MHRQIDPLVSSVAFSKMLFSPSLPFDICFSSLHSFKALLLSDLDILHYHFSISIICFITLYVENVKEIVNNLIIKYPKREGQGNIICNHTFLQGSLENLP
jgi:hypothetical protein